MQDIQPPPVKHPEHSLEEEIRRIGNVLTSGEVTRFHAVPSVFIKQTVAQHAWGVATLFTFIKTDPRPDAIMHALTHDMHELFTGDVPFTAKREVEDLALLLETAEVTYGDKHLFNMPRITEAEKLVLKFADMLEGLRWTAFNERAPHIVHGRWHEAIVALANSGRASLLNEGEHVRIKALHASFYVVNASFENETPKL